MEKIDSLQPSQDERIMAFLSHVFTMVPFAGVICPILMWATQREKSPYVKFHALQAMFYQLLLIGLGVLGYMAYMASFMFYMMSIQTFMSPGNFEDMGLAFGMMAVPFVVMGVEAAVMMVILAYGLVGAILALQGKPFRYLIIGRAVEKFIQKSALDTRAA